MNRRKLLQAIGGTTLASYFSGAAEAQNVAPPAATSGWQNWSKSLPSSGAQITAPHDLAGLKQLITSADGPVRPVGAGHSWMPLVPSDYAIVKLDHFAAVSDIDTKAQTAWIGAGAQLHDVSPILAQSGLAFRNLGDIDVQTLAGATSTATHGTGRNLSCLSAEILGLRMVTGDGDEIEISATQNADMLAGARVGLGSLGVLTEIKMQLVARHKLHRRVWFMPHDALLAQANKLWETHRNFEFFYIPFSGMSMCIAHDETQAADTPRAADESDDAVAQLKALRDYVAWFPALRKRLLGWAIGAAPEENVVGESWQLLSSARNTLFNEMEYHLPEDVGLAALEEVRHYIEAHRADVFFPFETRMTQADDNWLSPFQGARRMSLAVHCYHADEYQFLFTHVEPILRKYGGRPHWGKLNSLSGSDFAALYPQWQAFADMRRRLDPRGRMLNPYLSRLFDGAA